MYKGDSSIKRLLILAGLLILWGLALARFGQSLWLDEGSSVWFSHFPVPALLTSLCDPHPPGFYLLLKGWTALLGQEGEFTVRFPSAWAAILAVAVVYRLGVRWGGQDVGWLAALLLALQPLQAWYASEARMYVWVQLAGLMWVVVGRRHDDSTMRRLDDAAAAHHAPRTNLPLSQSPISQSPLSNLPSQSSVFNLQSSIFNLQSSVFLLFLSATLALWLDFTAFLAFGVLQLIWLAQGRPQPRRWIALHVMVLLPTLVVWFLLGSFRGLGNAYHVVFLAVAANQAGIPLTPDAARWVLLAGLAALGLGAVAAAWLWPTRFERVWSRRWILWLVAAGWLAFLAFSAAPRLFTVKRLLVVVLPYLALVGAHALHRLPRWVTSAALVLTLLATASTFATHQREPWREVVAQTMAQVQAAPGSVLWVDELAAPVFDTYARWSGVDAAALSWAPLFGRDLPSLPRLTPQPGRDLWLLTVEHRYRRLTLLLPEAFRRSYDLLDARHELGIGLYRYRRRAEPRTEASPSSLVPDAVRWGLLLPSPLDTCDAR